MGKKRKAQYNLDQEQHEDHANMWGSGSGGGSGRRKTSTKGGYATSRSSGVNEAAVAKMFAAIADEDDPTVASMEGISKLCDDLAIDPMEDIRILVLLWKLGANEKPAQISKEEWSKGCTLLHVDSISKFKALLPSLETGFLDRTEFKDFYKFTFQFNREGTHRTLDKELVTALLHMVLKDRIDKERLNTFAEFLGQTKGDTYSRITLDQWTSFLEFCYECEALEEYDEEMSAWPVLIDEYVEYYKKSCK